MIRTEGTGWRLSHAAVSAVLPEWADGSFFSGRDGITDDGMALLEAVGLPDTLDLDVRYWPGGSLTGPVAILDIRADAGAVGDALDRLEDHISAYAASRP